MVSIKINDKQVLQVLGQLTARAKNLRPAFAEIGEDVVESTKARFATATAPDGKPWQANSQVTIDRYLGLFKNSRKKDGTLSKAGQTRSAGKLPLTGETKSLRTTINYQLKGDNGVAIGSPKVYAAMQQFGGTKAKFPNLWGDIPARPFLGISSADQANILEIIGSYLVQ
ncbi:MAG: phage virion morphogenesis protein [Burkholderiaceae bacterium]